MVGDIDFTEDEKGSLSVEALSLPVSDPSPREKRKEGQCS
jgi:hypothetical protein